MGLSPAFEAGAHIASGFASNASYRAEAKQYEKNAKLAELQANQNEVLRREDYASTISSINALRTSRGLDIASPTGMAIAAKIGSEADRAIRADRLNALNQIDSYHMAAAVSRAKGRVSLLSGFLQGGSAIAKGFEKAAAAGAGG